MLTAIHSQLHTGYGLGADGAGVPGLGVGVLVRGAAGVVGLGVAGAADPAGLASEVLANSALMRLLSSAVMSFFGLNQTTLFCGFETSTMSVNPCSTAIAFKMALARSAMGRNSSSRSDCSSF